MDTRQYHYQCFTLIDITPTGVTTYSLEKELERNQQRNWETIQQIISLRTQPTIISTTTKLADVSDYTFGYNYQGQHKIWCLEFCIEFQDLYLLGADKYGSLKNDFRVAPVVVGLTETARPEMAMFWPSGADKNIYFMSVANN